MERHWIPLDPDGTTQTSSSDATRDVKIADHDGRYKLEKKVHGRRRLGVAAMAAKIQLERSRQVAMAGLRALDDITQEAVKQMDSETTPQIGQIRSRYANSSPSFCCCTSALVPIIDARMIGMSRCGCSSPTCVSVNKEEGESEWERNWKEFHWVRVLLKIAQNCSRALIDGEMPTILASS
jgi:hypothetical protein